MNASVAKTTTAIAVNIILPAYDLLFEPECEREVMLPSLGWFHFLEYPIVYQIEGPPAHRGRALRFSEAALKSAPHFLTRAYASARGQQRRGGAEARSSVQEQRQSCPKYQ